LGVNIINVKTKKLKKFFHVGSLRKNIAEELVLMAF
jgi:hypothetical protein